MPHLINELRIFCGICQAGVVVGVLVAVRGDYPMEPARFEFSLDSTEAEAHALTHPEVPPCPHHPVPVEG